MASTLIPAKSEEYYTSAELDNIILSTTSAFLSIFGTLFIMLTYLKWKDIQTTSRRILVYISFADFISSVVNTVSVLSPPNHTVCLVQSIIGTFFILSSFFWTSFLAVYLYVACTHKKIATAEKLMPLFHVIGWGVSCAIVCTGAVTNKFGDNGDTVSSGWCWIKTAGLSHEEQVEWMLLAGKFWEVLAFVVISILYVLIKRGMRNDLNNAENLQLSHRSSKAAQTAERKLILVPVSFILLRIWGTIRFFIFVVHKKSNIKWLIIMQGIGDNAPGFFNFLIFCFFTEKVLSKIRTVFRMCCYKLCPGTLVNANQSPDNSAVYKTPPGFDYKTFENSDEGISESFSTNDP